MKLGDLQKLARTISARNDAEAQQKLHQRMRELGLDPNNFYQELEMTSHLVDTHRDTSGSNAHIQLHSHNFCELLYCTNNCGAEYLVGSNRYRLQKGDLIFVPPGISHRPLLPENMAEPYMRYVLWLSQEFMEYYAALLPYPFTEKQATASMLRTDNTRWAHLGELFRNGVKEAEAQRDSWEAAVIGNTITLLTMIKRATDDHSAQTLKAEKKDLLDRIIAYLEQNYTKTIVIGDLAAKFYISSSTVSHLFKKKLGISLYRFVTQRRLIAAKSLIEQGLLLDQVAMQVGFQDYSSFYRAFKQEYGISPRQYRILQTAGGQSL